MAGSPRAVRPRTRRVVALGCALLLLGLAGWLSVGRDQHALADGRALEAGDVVEVEGVLSAWEHTGPDASILPNWFAWVETADGSSLGRFDPYGRGTVLEAYDGAPVTALVRDGRILALRFEGQAQLTSSEVGWRGALSSWSMSAFVAGFGLWAVADALRRSTVARVPGQVVVVGSLVGFAVGAGSLAMGVAVGVLVVLAVLATWEPGRWRRLLGRG